MNPPHVLRALTATLQARGVPPQAVLDGTGLDAARLFDADALVGRTQTVRACANALRRCGDASLPFEVAQRLRLADLGPVGVLLLSSRSVRQYLHLAQRYQALSGSVVELQAQDRGPAVGWTLAPPALPEPSPALARFLVALQMAVQLLQLAELLGTGRPPATACFAHAAPPDPGPYADGLRCPCRFDAPAHRLGVSEEVLDRRPRWADARTLLALEAACDAQLADLDATWSFAGKVEEVLRRLGDPGAGMKAVAAALRMTDRTLRRRLSMEGTSFSTLALQQKVRLATQRLQVTRDSVEAVAAVAGYSDSSNFRRAFVRWTRMTPTQFRRLSRD